MLSVFTSLLVSAFAQDAALPPPMGEMRHDRPALECAEHVRDDRARRRCLNRLFDEAESELETAHAGASEEAGDADALTGGIFSAVSRLDAAQSAWQAYRDAECARRASLMILSDDARDELVLDCRIALTRDRAAELRDQ